VKACFSNLKANNITHFNAPYRRKRKETLNGWCINLDQKNIYRKGDKLFVYKNFLGEMKYYGTKQLNK